MYEMLKITAIFAAPKPNWKDARAVEWGGLENR
jgi:hypothetical protein